MSKDDNKDRFRRFRVARKVKQQPADIETYAQQEIKAAESEQDETLRGTPEMERAVGKGCMGCVNITLLMFLIMLASIIATWFIRRKGV